MDRQFKGLKNLKKDCFAYDRAHYMCDLLDTDDCEGCKFYKTWEQFEDDQERARGILRAKGDVGLVNKYL